MSEREREWEGKGRREIESGKDRKNGGRVKEIWRENEGEMSMRERVGAEGDRERKG